MIKIDNSYLKEYIELDRELKEKSKILSDMKDNITKELEARKGKAIITRFYIAAFTLSSRSIFNIPKEIKDKYKTIKPYKILKVTEKK